MDSISNFPYFEVQFKKDGQVNDTKEAQKLLDFLKQQTTTDLFVISHGWNTDMADARNLYQNFFQQVRQVLDSGKVSGMGTRKFAILAVLWPSKKFAEQDLIAGGAASVESALAEAIEEQLATLEALVSEPTQAPVFEQLKSLIPDLEDSPKAREKFAQLVRSVLTQGTSDEEDASTDFFTLNNQEIMDRLSKPILPQPEITGAGGAAEIGEFVGATEGGAAGFVNFGGFAAAAGNLLNFATYYEMKQRAGVVGKVGLNPILQQIRSQNPSLKLHLMGHSFGGRLVSAAALGTGQIPPLKIETLSLMQAAFSHYGFADNFEGNKDGFFRKVVENKGVSGPILITHTKNDKAVGLAYPIASALAQDDAAAFGDENDRFGGIGRNGAQKTPEAIKGLSLLSVGQPYQFQAGKLHNLRADNVIKSHGDICQPEVAYAILTAVATT